MIDAGEYTVVTNQTCSMCAEPNMRRKPIDGPESRNATNYKCLRCGQQMIIPPHGNADESKVCTECGDTLSNETLKRKGVMSELSGQPLRYVCLECETGESNE